MQRNQKGFTLIEIIVVLLLVSIISATLLARSRNTADIDAARLADKIRGQILYAQSTAMKNNQWWGVKSNGSHQYWLFQYDDLITGSEFKFVFPGEDSQTISIGDPLNVKQFALYFNRFGQPFKDNPTIPVTAGNNLEIEITRDATTVRKITITPETGMIQ